jgi:citrate synthase
MTKVETSPTARATTTDSLEVRDTRTDRTYSLPITDGTIRAADLRQIKTSEDDFGMMSYDPAFLNTASTRSAITFIDGDKGILRYRGYPIEQLADPCGAWAARTRTQWSMSVSSRQRTAIRRKR